MRQLFFLITVAVCALMLLPVCSTKQDTSQISKELADNLTDDIDIPGGKVVKDKQPPAGNKDPAGFPQIDRVDAAKTIYGGDSFSIMLSTEFVKYEEISGVIVQVEKNGIKASGYIVAPPGKILVFDDDRYVKVEGTLGDDAKVAGQGFVLWFALLNRDGQPGNYAKWDVKIGGTSSSDGGTQRVRPDESFFVPVSEQYLSLSFNGVINTLQAVNEGKAVKGDGEGQARVGGEDVDAEASPRSYLQAFDGNDTRPMYRGREFVVTDIYQAVGSPTVNNAEYNVVRFMVEAKALASLKASGANTGAFSGNGLTHVANYLTTRKDADLFMKYCYLGVGDPGAIASKIFLDSSGNSTFAPGENYRVWGDVGLTADNAAIKAQEGEGLEEDGGRLCFYMKNGTGITRKEYDDVIIGFRLDCDLPADYLKPFSENYLTEIYKGEISNVQQMVAGDGRFNAFISGNAVDVSSKKSLSVQETPTTSAYLDISSVGSYVTQDNGDVSYTSSELYIGLDKARALPVGGTIVPLEGTVINSAIVKYELKDRDQTRYVKLCPVAVLDLASVQSSAFICKRQGDTFDIGTQLQA
ncbi:MAG: hypothetical protein WC889_12610, partial [Myxococcota bacterium]